MPLLPLARVPVVVAPVSEFVHVKYAPFQPSPYESVMYSVSHVPAVGALDAEVNEGESVGTAVGSYDGDDDGSTDGDGDVAPRLHELTVLPPPPDSPANDQPISVGYEPLPTVIA